MNNAMRGIGAFFGLIAGLILMVSGSPIFGFIGLLYVAWLISGMIQNSKPATPPNPYHSDRRRNSALGVQALYAQVRHGDTLQALSQLAGSSGDLFMAKQMEGDELSVRRWQDDAGWSLYVQFRNDLVESSTIASPDATVSVSFEETSKKPE
jgi:hypothetical protein